MTASARNQFGPPAPLTSEPLVPLNTAAGAPMEDWADLPLEPVMEPPDMLEQAERSATSAAAVNSLNILDSLACRLQSGGRGLARLSCLP